MRLRRRLRSEGDAGAVVGVVRLPGQGAFPDPVTVLDRAAAAVSPHRLAVGVVAGLDDLLGCLVDSDDRFGNARELLGEGAELIQPIPIVHLYLRLYEDHPPLGRGSDRPSEQNALIYHVFMILSSIFRQDFYR